MMSKCYLCAEERELDEEDMCRECVWALEYLDGSKIEKTPGNMKQMMRMVGYLKAFISHELGEEIDARIAAIVTVLVLQTRCVTVDLDKGKTMH